MAEPPDTPAAGVPPAEEEPRAAAEAETLGEAKWQAVKELERRFPGLGSEEVSFEVLQQADPGADVPARVEATADLERWRRREERFELPDGPEERVRELLRRIATALDLRASVTVEVDEDQLVASLDGPELGLFIGKHGQTIDAIQHLAGQIAYRGLEDERRRVVVDAAGYRERRAVALCRQADRAAEDALRYGRPVELDSMSAQERRVVHEHLKERGDVETHSEGEDPDRRVVVTPLD